MEFDISELRQGDLRDVKTFDIKQETVETLEQERAIVHYISTPDLDLGGDTVDPKGMDSSWFEKHKTVFYNHDYDKPIAKNMWLKKKEEGVLVKTQFASSTLLADDIYNLHKEGIINTWSIGWRPKKKNGKIEEGALEYDEAKNILSIHKWELIEYSSAPLAMNPNALDQMKCLCKSNQAKELIKDYEEILRIENIVNEQGTQIKSLVDLVNELKGLIEAKVNSEDFQKVSEKILDLEQQIENKKIEIQNSTSIEIVGKEKLTSEKMANLIERSTAGAISRYQNNLTNRRK